MSPRLEQFVFMLMSSSLLRAPLKNTKKKVPVQCRLSSGKQEREVRRLQQSWFKTTCIVFYNNMSAGHTSLLQVYRCYWTYVAITILFMENVAIKGRGGNDVQHKNWKGKILRIWITINRHGCLHRGEGEGCVGIHCAIAAAFARTERMSTREH